MEHFCLVHHDHTFGKMHHCFSPTVAQQSSQVFGLPITTTKIKEFINCSFCVQFGCVCMGICISIHDCSTKLCSKIFWTLFFNHRTCIFFLIYLGIIFILNICAYLRILQSSNYKFYVKQIFICH